MPLRQVQAYPLQGYRLRPLRRGGYREESAPRAHGPHFVGRARGAYLVLPVAALEDRLSVGYPVQEAGGYHLLRALRRHQPRCCCRAGHRASGDPRRKGVPRRVGRPSEGQPGAGRQRSQQVRRHDGRRGDLHVAEAGRSRFDVLRVASQGFDRDFAAAQVRGFEVLERHRVVPCFGG